MMTTKRAMSLVLLFVLNGAAFGCRESTTFTGPDGVTSGTDPGAPGEWSEPVPVEPGMSVWVFGTVDELGNRWVVEIDWESAANDVDVIVYEGEVGPDFTPLCSVPDDFFDPGLPTCAVTLSDVGSDKPKRVEWMGERGGSHSVVARNNGPGPERVRVREIRFDR